MPQRRPARPPRVCVFLASSDGDDPGFVELARATGEAIAARGWELVYGGGFVGTMGVLADAAIDGGARVTGVLPTFMDKVEGAHERVADLLPVGSMHDRKATMHALADGFLVLPGGLGTLEEFVEAWTWTRIGLHDKPIVLLDHLGFWDGFLDWMRQVADHGFVEHDLLDAVRVATDPATALDQLGLDWPGRIPGTPDTRADRSATDDAAPAAAPDDDGATPTDGLMSFDAVAASSDVSELFSALRAARQAEALQLADAIQARMRDLAGPNERAVRKNRHEGGPAPIVWTPGEGGGAG